MVKELLEFSVVNFTTNQIELKVKNKLEELVQTLVIELYLPKYLVDQRIKAAAVAAAKNQKPVGVASLAGIVTGPDGWSVWARPETSDSTVIIAFFNDLTQDGKDLAVPVKLPPAAEFTIRIPLNPQANRTNANLPFTYLYGTADTDLPVAGKLELKPAEIADWTPDVSLTTNHGSPTAITAGSLVKIFWHVQDGVSATLRGPLDGGNSELTLSNDPAADFKISDGSIQIRVVTGMTYILQAEVKRPDGKPNVQVMRMLTLNTSNKGYTYLDPRPSRVLPYGLIEIDWAAWGIKQVTLSVSNHTTRVIQLTQQTLGRFYEGTGILRVSATPTDIESIKLDAPPEKGKSRTVQVVKWEKINNLSIKGHIWGLAVIAPRMALLTLEGLFIAHIPSFDSSNTSTILAFTQKTGYEVPTEWIALTAVDNRFLTLRRTSYDLEVAPFTVDGSPDEIPPLVMPADIRRLVADPHATFDFVGFGNRGYIAIQAPLPGGVMRRAFSVSFNRSTKKAEYRSEPMLETLTGYRLVTFDDGLYALNRETGRMFRFDLIDDKLGPAREAASAVKKGENGAKDESMIKDGLFVPVGRVFAVLNPTSVPTIASLEQYGHKNVLSYENQKSQSDDGDKLPQDLVYNPQKNYWGRCGRGLATRPDAVVAFREGTSPRLWVIQGEPHEGHTLAVGGETLFAQDYVLDYATKPLPPYLNKKRQFNIKSNVALTPVPETYLNQGIVPLSTTGPVEVTGMPTAQTPVMQFTVDVHYNEANPAPVTLRLQLARTPQSRPKEDFLLEVRLSGPDLSTATSSFRRVSTSFRLINEEMVGSRVEHPTNKPIEITRPPRFEEIVQLVVVNSSEKFRIKPKNLNSEPAFIIDRASIRIDSNRPDFSLGFDGREPTQGELTVNIDYAAPHGIEASQTHYPQTKLIRLNTDKIGKILVMMMKLLMPGDQPLRIQGVAEPISAANQPVCVCQLDYKP